MNYEILSEKQIDIIKRVELMFENAAQMETWFSLPNKLFRGKAPMDLLLAGNFDYFERLLNKEPLDYIL